MKRLIPAVAIVLSLASALGAMEPGWQISPVPGEGDRASLGCSRDTSDTDFACLAVRCEDDFTVGVHVYSSRLGGSAGRWEMTLDREERSFQTSEVASPYGAKFDDKDGVLLDRIRHGTFIYLRHAEDEHAPFRYLDLSGSFRAIEEALLWCAPRVPPAEQNSEPDVNPAINMEISNEPSPARTQ